MERLRRQAREAVMRQEEALDAREEFLYARLQEAFREAGVHQADLASAYGYGYDDAAIAKLEHILARMMGTEDCFFRPQIVSGTQALSLVLEALSEVVGGRFLFPLDRPYDTLWPVIGWGSDHPRTLIGRGHEVIALPFEVGAIPERLLAAAPPGPGVAWLQRSMGYQQRPTLRVTELRPLITCLHQLGYVVVVDNCYGEWTEAEEPGHAGADLVVGSFLKNPGGGLAPYGAYVAGQKAFVDLVAERLFGPALGRRVAPHEDLRPFFQGLYWSPHAVGQALRAAIYGAALFSAAGFPVDPPAERERGCIVQGIVFGEPAMALAFCQAIQSASPLDAEARPEPWPMPGYDAPVVMAGGTFIPGGTLELSADGRHVPPYRITFQGGISYPAARLALDRALESVALLS